MVWASHISLRGPFSRLTYKGRLACLSVVCTRPAAVGCKYFSWETPTSYRQSLPPPLPATTASTNTAAASTSSHASFAAISAPPSRAFKRKFSSIAHPTDSSPPPPPLDLHRTVFIFTDGSCLGNQNVATTVCPAGWGFVAVRPTSQVIHDELLQAPDSTLKSFIARQLRSEDSCTTLVQMHGPVVVDRAGSTPGPWSRFTLGAEVASNNTGELSAMAEAFLWITTFVKEAPPTPSTPRLFVIAYDSEYAAKSITGEFNGAKNKSLILTARRLRQEAIRAIRAAVPDSGEDPIRFVHVQAHSEVFWNERADRLALAGAQGHVSAAGRYCEAVKDVSTAK